MDIKIMKKHKVSLMGRVLGIMMLVAGVQWAWAAGCLGTVYFKAPDSWTTVYLATQNHAAAKMTKDPTTGYYVAELDSWPQETYQVKGFSIGNSITAPVQYITATNWVATESGDAGFLKNNQIFQCPGDGKTLYILENPASPGKTVVSTEPPDAKYIYFLVPPENDNWMAAIPMVSLDGGQTAVRMTADPDRCGWFYYVWFGQPVSDNVVFMRDDAQVLDSAIGVNGTAEENIAQPIPLQSYYDAFSPSNTIYFIPDQDLWLAEGDGGFYDTDPGVEGVCSYTLAAIIYDSDAKLHPAFSCDYYTSAGQINEGCQDGVTALGVDLTTARQRVQNCIGVHTGIVLDTLGADKKPHLNTSATGNGVKCFGTAQLFDMLFTHTPGVNEMSCYDMPFGRADDNRWEFDSDKFTSPGTTIRGGFYPVELTDNDVILAADPTQTPAPLARTKRAAQGPVYMTPYMRKIDPASGEEAPRMDLVCNSSTWTGGHNCEGKYAGGGDIYTWYPNTITGASYEDVWCWGSYCNAEAPDGWPMYVTGTGRTNGGDDPRWGTDQEADATDATRRNQQFCFESHANFVHKPGLRFSFRGDDDIWVFIDNKLAVDLGGTHLAAPGYVILDDFIGKSGKLVEGQTYDIDVFFCDRRTTMSNVRIKTNMYIQQKTGITDKVTKAGAKETHKLCLVKTGDGGCASQLSGSSKADTLCDIVPTYALTRANGDMVMDNVPVGTISKGCIDLTQPSIPVITKDKCTLGPGRYHLVATVEGKSKKITFKVNGELDIATRDAIAIDSNGTTLPGNYAFKQAAMGGEFVPLYISAIADPCQGNVACAEPLEMDVSSAPGQAYTLEVDAGLTVYTMNALGQLEVLPSGSSRTIGAGGVDTIYVTAALIGMMTSPTVYHVGVAGRAKAAISFYAPTISFMKDSVTTTEVATGDPVTDERWVGTYYEFYLAAFKPNGDGTMSLCTECNFALLAGSMMSPKLELLTDSISIVNGRGMISIRSLKEYRTDDNPSLRDPATIHITGENPNLTSAMYTPVFFRDPPVPYPVLVDIFDVKGAVPKSKLGMPKEYAPADQEYLDGIGDSLAIYYNRSIAKDSLPDSVFVHWDNGTDSVKIGHEDIVAGATCGDIKTLTKDGQSWQVDYCKPLIQIGGRAKDYKFSEGVKTAGTSSNTVSSWAHFEDKGKYMSQAFGHPIIDRIAPVIKGALVMPEAEGSSFDQLTLVLSEPAIIDDQFLMEGFQFYLNSATELSDNARFRAVKSQNGPTVKDTIKLRFQNDNVQNPSPHVGDYVRFRADSWIWTDTAKITEPGSDTLRADDATMHWNSPTDYVAGARMPSPWVALEGAAEVADQSINYGYADPAKMKDPSIELFTVPQNFNLDSIRAKYPNTLGKYLKTDMKSLKNSSNQFKDVKPDDVYFQYEMDIFTNLGGFVTHKEQKVECTDKAIFDPNNEGKTCFDDNQNFYIAWNMTTDKNRLVGAGAYIVKWKSHVYLGAFKKKNKLDGTEVWGVRRPPKKKK
jgi:fibro-slime domain